MKIKTILNQHRRDIQAIYICEYCKAEEKGNGYDDAYFHNKVIPDMLCKECGKQAGADYRALTPKYSANTII